ncbi:MAG: LLM class flavin-dependent oxidoreductase, partial [Myxococcales bacterium]
MLTGPHERRRELLARVAASGLDHVFVADHVSFHDGFGMDGLVQAATLLASEPALSVQVGVYLLALRHPVTVARQIATLCESAPGRLVLGVGVGGEDRHEIEICGVDPATRGRRLA